ncbi:MAG: acyl-CoA thioesterase [Fuerstiella sp.]|jgi:acyl-CoA thioester hydrolase|nr:acyl-CoA thioesterase [Fuerstiella sp.]MCP4512647.1 acyl-CoA thioesterase [Fuerstiella sp.]MDG2129753.1 thioesterase family protein [Fuerstiella sp.]
MPKPQLIETRERYSIFSMVTTRWKDNDVYGHVNNAVYNAWMDTAVTEFFREHHPGFPDTRLIPVGAETHLTFHRSISHPAEVETGVRVENIGSRSAKCGVGIFTRDQPEAAAWGHMIHVWVDRNTNQAVSIPEYVRRALESALMHKPAPH